MRGYKADPGKHKIWFELVSGYFLMSFSARRRPVIQIIITKAQTHSFLERCSWKLKLDNFSQIPLMTLHRRTTNSLVPVHMNCNWIKELFSLTFSVPEMETAYEIMPGKGVRDRSEFWCIHPCLKINFTPKCAYESIFFNYCPKSALNCREVWRSGTNS